MRHAMSPKPMVSVSIHHAIYTLSFPLLFTSVFFLFIFTPRYLVVKGIYDATHLERRRWHFDSVYKSDKFAKWKTIGFGDNLQFGFPHKFLAKPLLHIEHLKCRAIEKLAFPLIFFATRFAISIYNRNNNSEMNNNAPCWQAITNGIGFLLLQFVCSTSSHMPHPLLTPQHTHWFLLVAQWSKNLVQRRK